MSVSYFGLVGHYFSWVVVSGGVWGFILEELGWVGHYFGWVGVGGSEWQWVHSLIMLKLNN